MELFTSVNQSGVAAGRQVFEFVNGDLVDDDLQELVTLRLFTWRRARDEDKIPEGASRQGWFADPDFGSRLWLLNYRALDTAAYADAREYVREALADLVTEGILSGVETTVEPHSRGILLDVRLRSPKAPEGRLRYAYFTQPEA